MPPLHPVFRFPVGQRLLGLAALLLLAAKSAEALADAADAFVSGNTLNLPVIVVEPQSFSATFLLVENTLPVQLELTSAVELPDADTAGASRLDGTMLTIPRINVDGTVYRAELELSSEDPVRFTLVAADAIGTSPPQVCTPPVPDPSHGDNNPELINGSLVPLDLVLDGGPGPDGIPPLTDPAFIHPDDAILNPEDLVVGVKIGSHVRAYPHNILDWHEIVNITAGRPYTLSYCPLTGSAVLWKAFMEPVDKTFGTSGLLYNSNLVLYDRETQSLWSQMLEQSIRGPEVRRIPERLQVVETRWSTWLEMYPEAPVLSMDTGFSRDYFEYPYFNFKTSNDIFFPVNNSDDLRLHRKTRVVGINVGEASKVYPIENFGDGVNTINDRVGELEVVVVGSTDSNFGLVYSRHVEDGCTILDFAAVQDELPVVMRDSEGSRWDIFGTAVSGPRAGTQLARTNSYIAYWFAWTAFFPGAEIHQ